MAFSDTQDNNAAARQARWSSMSAPGGPGPYSGNLSASSGPSVNYSGGGPTGSGGYAAQLQPQSTGQALQQSTPGGGNFSIEGRAKNKASRIDQSLVSIMRKAAEGSPYDVQLFSGYRGGDRRQHGRGNAVDIALIDRQTGKPVPNYQSATGFPIYEDFAKRARAIQMQDYPELADSFRWGGYFSGGKNKYGSVDLMHFDVNSGMGMAGGSWDSGLTPTQAKLVAAMGGGETRWAGGNSRADGNTLANLWGRAPFARRDPGGPPINPRTQPRTGSEGARSMMGYAPQPETQSTPFEAVMEPQSQETNIPLPRPRPDNAFGPAFAPSRAGSLEGVDITGRQEADIPLPQARPAREAPGIPTPQPRPAPQGFGVGRFDAAEPGPTFDPSQGQGQPYVVQAGDSLWAIAERYLGDGRRWQEIAQANGIANPNQLQIGQNLVLPGQSQTQVAGIPNPPPNPRREQPIGVRQSVIPYAWPPSPEQQRAAEEEAQRLFSEAMYEQQMQKSPSFVSSNGVRIWVEQGP